MVADSNQSQNCTFSAVRAGFLTKVLRGSPAFWQGWMSGDVVCRCPLPLIRSEVDSGPCERTRDKAQQVRRRPDHPLPGRRLRSNLPRGGIRKEHEAGISFADPCRKHGGSDATLFRWKATRGGMDGSGTERLRGKDPAWAAVRRLSRFGRLSNSMAGVPGGVRRRCRASEPEHLPPMPEDRRRSSSR